MEKLNLSGIVFRDCLPVALEMTPGARLGLILQASAVFVVDRLPVVVDVDYQT